MIFWGASFVTEAYFVRPLHHFSEEVFGHVNKAVAII